MDSPANTESVLVGSHPIAGLDDVDPPPCGSVVFPYARLARHCGR